MSSSPHHDAGDLGELVVRPRSLAWYGVAQAVPGITMLASVPIWIRLVGGEQYGEYAVVWAVGIASAAFSTGWLRQSLLRETGLPAGTLSALPRWSLAACVLVPGAVVGVAALWVLDRDPLALAIAYCFGVSIAVSLIVSTVLQQRERAPMVALAESGRAVATLALSLVLVEVASPTSESLLAAAAIANVGVVVLVRRPGTAAWDGRPSNEVLGGWWAYGWPLSVWLGLAPAMLYSDRILLGQFVDDATLGAYAASSDLVVRGVAVVATPVAMVLHPALMRAANRGEPEAAVAVSKTWAVRLAMVLAIGVVLVAVAGRWLNDLVLDSGTISTSTLVGLSVGASLWQLGLLLHKPLEIERRTGVMLVVLSCSLAAGLLLVAVLARFGPEGAAWGMASGTGVYVAATLVVTRSRRGTT